jgi:glycosyltransferase involved in cell wall biosynthesis
MRYAWDFDAERERFPRVLRPGARLAMRGFRQWDRNTATRVTRFVANSRAVAARITRCYGRPADVVHPPVRTTFYTPSGARRDRFLYVGRLTGYKRPDLAVDAFSGLPAELDVVGEGPMLDRLRERAGPNVRLLGAVSDEDLRDLYRRARALVFPVDEDFGITMAEAQACGTPVIGLAAGGALDIVDPGVTGWLIERQDVNELQRAIRTAMVSDLDESLVRASGERFSESRFRRTMTEIVQEVVG